MWWELSSIRGISEGQWVICGDFNVSRFPSKRTNCNRITRAMADFNQCINDLELLDPPLSRGSYTWRRCQNHSYATRIVDSCSFTNGIRVSPNQSKCSPHIGSNHNPIQLSCDDWKHRKSYFKFENWCLRKKDSKTGCKNGGAASMPLADLIFN